MTQVRFIGDIHGKWGGYKKIIKSAPAAVSLQLGDFGVGFYKPYSDPLELLGQNPPHSAMAKGSHYFIRGNHDNPSVCATHPFWVKDGTYAPLKGVEGVVFCVGGATSIDAVYRTTGYTWWEDEELSYAQWMGVISDYEVLKPNIVATHDLPESACAAVMRNLYAYPNHSRTRQALDNLLDIHKPAVWVHGHWHVSYRQVYRGVEFIGVGEGHHLDLECSA